ncbi:MAG: Jag N-terminal domain-containing protein [Candidatus Omnitrophica bacterium]|nr:Jag N-terminal domain-containing protein [Candidatus Omnitrophota bacterium]
MSNNVHSEEFEGADVEEAIRKAMAHFSSSREELEIKVVREEKKGLFGMAGEKTAKIKVFLKNK